MCEKMEFDNDSHSIGTRYRVLRKRLENLGYSQTLPVEALPLVEKLLGDLIQTTESLRHYKAIAQDRIEISGHQEFSVDPYKCDNAKLVQECNQLHADLLEAREGHLKQTKELKRKISQLETECSDLQLASSRNLKRLKDLEVESSNKSKRIQELLGKCCKPTVNNSVLSTKKRSAFPLRKPVIDGDVLTPELLRGSSSATSLSKVKGDTVNLIAMGDRKINSLSHDVMKLKAELELQCDNVQTLKTQLAMKEKEANRLRKMLEGGRPYLAVSKDCSCQRNETNCIQCNLGDNKGSRATDVNLNEIKVLHQVKSNLEQQLREALEKQHDAMSQAMKLAERNEELEKELRDIDHIALAVEADCNSTVKENNRRVSQLQEKLEKNMARVHQLENDLLSEKRASQELRADLEASKLEKRNLQRALDSASDEKKSLLDRINQLTLIEQTLNNEIERLSRLTETQKHELVQLECVNESLKKQMVNDSSQVLNKNTPKISKNKSDKNDKNSGKLLKKKNGTKTSRVQHKSSSPPVEEKISSDVDEMRKQIEEKEIRLIELQDSVEKLRREKDYYKEEMEKLKRDSGCDNELWSQICDLKHQLNEKEMKVSELQREKREICREKLELESRLQGCRSRSSPCAVCSQCRSVGPCVCLSLSPKPEAAGSKLIMARLERERDTARTDVERLSEERDILRERLKMTTEAHTYEQRRLKDTVRDLECRMKELERERQELLLAQGSRRTAIAGIENQLEEARDELRRTKQELASQRTQYFQLRALQDQTDQALGDVQSQLNQSETELSKALERNRCLDQQQLQLENQVKELKDEINTHRTNMARLDHEKDQLLMELDNKTERIVALEREVLAKEQQTIATEQQLRELQHKNQICMDQSAEQERQLRSMQMEMENNQRQLAAASADRDNAAQENRRLQDDLAALTCEIRTLQRELDASRAESYDLKRQLQTYVSEVRRAEELLNRKENERTEMLNHFRSLSLEATVLENNNHSLETEAAEARGALQSARDRILDLERQLADKDCLIRGYEAQITELTQHVASLETQVRQQTDQRSRTEADLNAVRDLCVKLDQQKENLMKELGDRDAIKSQYEAQISRLRAEQSMVQEQINRDHVTVDRMEALLDQARQEALEYQSQNQEFQNEISRMKQRICELQNKLSAESAELRRYQNQAAEYSKQISELRRQVTNERFDRARKEEEHRRNFVETGHAMRFQSPPIPQDLSTSITRYSQNTVQHDMRPVPLTAKCSDGRRASRVVSPGNTFKDSVSSEEDRAIVQLRGPKNGETTHQTISLPGTGNLCVSTTIEEHDDRNDLKIKITDVNASNQSADTSLKTTSFEKDRSQEELRQEATRKKSDTLEAVNKKACGCTTNQSNLPNCPALDNIEASTANSVNGESMMNSSIKKNDVEGDKNRRPSTLDKLKKKFHKKSNTKIQENPNSEDKPANVQDNREKHSSQSNSDGDNLEVQQLTSPDFIRLLSDMKEFTRNLNDQMAMMNSIMESQNSNLDETIYKNSPIVAGNKNTYKPGKSVDNEKEFQDIHTDEFNPPLVSTPKKKKKIDFNHNVVDQDEDPAVVTTQKEISFARRNPSSGSKEIGQIKFSKRVTNKCQERDKLAPTSKIPGPSTFRHHKSSNGMDNWHSQIPETRDFSGQESNHHTTGISPRKNAKSRSAQSSRQNNEESLAFHTMPDRSYYSEYAESAVGSDNQATCCNRRECAGP